jgi:[ribosomal protein S18]-alanine N-acetyltransferase
MIIVLPYPSNPSLILKPLDIAVLPAVIALDQQCLGGLWSLDGYQRELDSPNSDLIGLFHRSRINSDDTLIGFGCLWAILEEAHITVLAVHPNYQRQGLGQVLLWQLLQSAHLRGLEWATLEVRPSNQAAILLYAKFGFQEVGRRRRYYQNTGEDALILWRRGLQDDAFQQQLLTWKHSIRLQIKQNGWDWPILNPVKIASSADRTES